MKPTLINKLPVPDDSPHHVWEIVAAQLLLAGVTASWFYIDDHFGFDRGWIETYVISAFYWLNMAAIFIVPVAVGCLLLVAAIQRSYHPLIYAGVEAVLWYVHLLASFAWPWTTS